MSEEVKLVKGVNYESVNFGPFVMGVKMPDHVTEGLLERGRKLNDPANKVLAGHIKNEHHYTIEDRDWFMKETGYLFAHYRRAHDEYHGLDHLLHNIHGMKGFNIEVHLHDLWVNFMREGEYNPPHNHSGDLSFVTFLKLPPWEEELKNHIANSPPPGSLVFQNELDATPQHSQWKTTNAKMFPYIGVLWIFPALLSHVVYPYKTPGERISVSGNLIYTNRDKFPKNYF